MITVAGDTVMNQSRAWNC